MKKYIITSLLGLLFFTNNINAQCTTFAKEHGLKVLDTEKYVHDGRFNAIKLKQGDDIYIYKAFYAGENYRIVFVADEKLGNIKVEMTDFRRQNVIFNNENGNSFFDFHPTKSQRCIIHIQIPAAKANQTEEKGCVAILFGLKKEASE